MSKQMIGKYRVIRVCRLMESCNKGFFIKTLYVVEDEHGRYAAFYFKNNTVMSLTADRSDGWLYSKTKGLTESTVNNVVTWQDYLGEAEDIYVHLAFDKSHTEILDEESEDSLPPLLGNIRDLMVRNGKGSA
jgi:hypothetical protein